MTEESIVVTGHRIDRADEDRIDEFEAIDETRVLLVVTSHDRIDDDTPTGLWFEEFAVPFETFRDHDYAVVAASPGGGIVPIDPRSGPDAEERDEHGAALALLRDTERLEAIDPDDFDAVFFPGGHGTMFDFVGDEDVRRVVEAFDRDGKLVAAVCHGPAALVEAESADGTPVVEGVRLTAFTDAEEREVGLDEAMPFLLESRLRELGAEFVVEKPWSDHVEVDGRWITGQNPRSSRSAAEAVVNAIQSRKAAETGAAR